MKSLKFLAVVVVAGALAASLAGCGAKAAQTTSTQVAAVQRGDLTVSITGTGNLAFSKSADLTFDMAGAVQEILVDEGETVTEGEVLASLDTDAWDDQLKKLENTLTTAERNRKTAERQITARELAVRQAELDLQAAEGAVADIPAVKAAQDLVDMAESALTAAQAMYGASSSVNSTQVMAIQQQLADAKRNLQSVLAGTSFNLTSDISLQISKSLLNVDQGKRKLEDAEIAVADATTAAEDARQAVDDAQNALNEAKDLSPTITAPFAGFIARINVEGGDEVQKGTVIMQIADPTKFEADILVGENDIFQVQVGGDATVQVDALSSLTLPAKVTYVASTATAQQGVVNYKVRVELQSFESIAQERQQARQGAGQAISPEQLAERMKDAVAQGRMTQEQADAFLKQMQEGGGGGGFFFRQGTPGQTPDGSSGQLIQPSGAAPSSPQLKQGLSVTVNVISAQRTNVLLVPNDAITRKAGATVVTVQTNGATEQRQVTCGVSDWQNTEVVSGLNEGDQVVITKSTTTGSSSRQNQGGMFFGAPAGGNRVVVPR